MTNVDTNAGSDRRGRDLGLLLLGILVLHLIVAYLSRNGIVRDDAESYVVLGRNIARGFGYVFAPGRPQTAWRAPGFPIWLAVIFRISGGGLWAARTCNALLWTLTSFLGYRVSAAMLPALFPRMPSRVRHGVALLTSGMIGFYPEFVGLTGLLWSESLFIPMFLSAVWALWALSRRRTASAALIAGTAIGLCALTRSTSVILIPAIWFAVLRQGATRLAIRNGVLASAAAVLLIGCWTARNRMVMGKFILVESNVGYNLYVGNRPDTPIPFAWTRAASLPRDPLYQQLIVGRTEAEASTALTHAAIQQMTRNPGRTALLGVGKVFDFWLPDFFIALNLRSGAFGSGGVRLWRPFLAVSVLAYLIVALTAMAGIVAGRKIWEARFLVLVVILYTLPHALVYGASRYHLPLMPLLIVLAAPVIRRIWLAIVRRTNRTDPASETMSPL